MAPPFKEHEIKKEERFSSVRLVEDLKIRGTSSFFYEDIEKMSQAIVSSLEGKSVIVIMSNGPFGGIHNQLKTLLS